MKYTSNLDSSWCSMWWLWELCWRFDSVAGIVSLPHTLSVHSRY